MMITEFRNSQKTHWNKSTVFPLHFPHIMNYLFENKDRVLSDNRRPNDILVGK